MLVLQHVLLHLYAVIHDIFGINAQFFPTVHDEFFGFSVLHAFSLCSMLVLVLHCLCFIACASFLWSIK